MIRPMTHSDDDDSAPAPAPAVKINWAPEVAKHDYAAAQAYLSIKFAEDKVTKIVSRLRDAPLTTRRANDILRATGLTPAPLDDPGVMKDLIKVRRGQADQSHPRHQWQARRGNRRRISPGLARVPARPVR